MKKTIIFLLFFSPFFVTAQIGIKAGLNFANVSKASSINNSSRSGFHVGIFLAPSSKKILSSRTELIFSRQGYNYKTNTNTGNVNLDYIQMGQLKIGHSGTTATGLKIRSIRSKPSTITEIKLRDSETLLGVIGLLRLIWTHADIFEASPRATGIG